MPMIVTGIDFDESSVKIIQVKKTRDKVILLKLASAIVPCEEEDEKELRVAQVIAELLKIHKIKPINLNTCINRRFVTIRYLELPSRDEKEIAQMVKFQAAKLLPYPLEELITAYKILHQQNDSSQVMVVVTHKDIVNKHLEILKRINLEPVRILLSSEAIFNSCGYTQQPTFSSMAILDIGYSSTDIDFINQGRLLFTRSASISWENGKNVGGLINELKTSLKAYKREIKDLPLQEVTPQKIIISGDVVANIEGLDKKLAEDIDVPVEICNPFKGFIIPPRLIGEYGLTAKKPQLTTVVGLVVGDKKEEVNLLPESVRLARKRKEKRFNLILTGLLVASLILLLSIFAERRIYDTYQYLNCLNYEIAINLPLTRQIELKKKRLNAIKKEMSNQGLSLDIIAEVYRLIPHNISLNEFIFEEGDSLTILRGEAKEMSSIFSLITILEKSPYFKNVKITYATKRAVGEKEVVDFQITCPLGN